MIQAHLKKNTISFFFPLSIYKKEIPFQDLAFAGRMGMTAEQLPLYSVSPPFCECHIRKKWRSFNCLETWLATKKNKTCVSSAIRWQQQ